MKPSRGEVTQEEIEHKTKHGGHEHAASLGRGESDLEKLIREYFDIVQRQLAKHINKLRTDLQARADAIRRRNLRVKNSDEETNELFERRLNREDCDDQGNKQG